MRKIFVIAVRDYNAAVRTKAFVISLVIMPLEPSDYVKRNQADWPVS